MNYCDRCRLVNPLIVLTCSPCLITALGSSSSLSLKRGSVCREVGVKISAALNTSIAKVLKVLVQRDQAENSGRCPCGYASDRHNHEVCLEWTFFFLIQLVYHHIIINSQWPHYSNWQLCDRTSWVEYEEKKSVPNFLIEECNQDKRDAVD